MTDPQEPRDSQALAERLEASDGGKVAEWLTAGHPRGGGASYSLDRLRTLDTVLRGHDAEAPVAELREQIRGALTTART